MRRLAALALLVAGCSRDPIVGRWGTGSKVIELHRDGLITGIHRDDPSCAGETDLVAACATQQRWERWDGAYQLTMTAVYPRRELGTSRLFLERDDESRCVCTVEVTGTAQVEGDVLVIDGGKEGIPRGE